MLTPVRVNAPDQLDLPALDRLIEHLLHGGVHGLFILGTTGEGPALSYETRRSLITHTTACVKHRVPVLVGLLDISIPEMLNLAHHAAASSADAVVLAPPCYFPLSQADLLRFAQSFAAESPLPILLYNTPHSTIRFELDTLHHLADHPRILGLKDSSGDPAYLHHLLEWKHTHPHFNIYVGPEQLLPAALANGANGGVSGGANLFPRLYVDWYNSGGDPALTAKVRQVWDNIYTVGDPASSIVRGLKCALAHLGICSEQLVRPYAPPTEAERARVHRFLESFNHEKHHRADEADLSDEPQAKL